MTALRIEEHPEGRRMVAARALARGEVLGRVEGTRQARAEKFTLQLSALEHLRVAAPWTFLNHACEPSVRIDVDTLEVVALRDLEAGAELTLFYPSTEWDLGAPFPCRCSASTCAGWVAGARYLPSELLSRHALAPHIRGLMARRDDGATAAMHPRS